MHEIQFLNPAYNILQNGDAASSASLAAKPVSRHSGEKEKEGIIMSVFWLAGFVLFTIAEGITVGLVSAWFAIGSLAAFLASVLATGIEVQLIIFTAVSTASLVFLRPILTRFFKTEREPTNADRVIGAYATVTEPIDDRAGVGQVNIRGQVWTARSQSGEHIHAGALVKVLRIEGVKVFVEPVENIGEEGVP